MAARGRSGSRLDRLKALRLDLERSMAGEIPVRDRASLSREYRAVLAEIDELAPAETRGDAVDEITQRRNARRTPAPRTARARRPS